MLNVTKPHIRELREIDPTTDSRDYLAHATKQAEAHEAYELIVDVDAHLTEPKFWPEIISFVDNDVLKHLAQSMMGRAPTPLINFEPGMNFQSMGDRIQHIGSSEKLDDPAVAGHPFVQTVRRSINALGLDYQVIFPTGMLFLGMNPMDDIEIHLARAYNRWLTEKIIPEDKRMLGLLYLPFNSPEDCERIIDDFGSRPGVVGYTVCSVRNKPVHHNRYMRLYAKIEETGKPLMFHSGPWWQNELFSQLNRFVSMHAISFVHFNLVHLTNWIINALPERFPKLKVVWVESGLAWVPFIMQRLDHEVMLRQNEAPGLKRLPSEYIREMFFTSQPLERNDLNLLKSTMDAMHAETQLLYASDWPHWDFDPPRAITSLNFLSDQAKRNILGLNAARLFNIPVKRVRPSPQDVLASRPHVS